MCDRKKLPIDRLLAEMSIETQLLWVSVEGKYSTPHRYQLNRILREVWRTEIGFGPTRILDIGCGDGRYYHFLRIMGVNGSYVGMDIAFSGFWPWLESNYYGNSLSPKFVQGDAERLPFTTNSFDVILFLTSIEVIPNDETSLCLAARCLKPGGKMIIATASRFSWLLIGRYSLKHRYTIQELESLGYRCGLQVVAHYPIGGAISLVVQALWLNINWLLGKLGRVVFYLCYGGRKPAKDKFPHLVLLLSQPLWLHLLTALGRRLHSTLNHFLYLLDSYVRVGESGYVVIYRKPPLSNASEGGRY